MTNIVANTIDKLTANNTFGKLFLNVNNIINNLNALSTGNWEKNKGSITLTSEELGFICNTAVQVKNHTLTIKDTGDFVVESNARIDGTLNLNSTDIQIDASTLGKSKFYDVETSNTTNTKILMANTGFVSNTLIFTNTDTNANIIYAASGVAALYKANISNTLTAKDIDILAGGKIAETLNLNHKNKPLSATSGTCEVYNLTASANLTANNISATNNVNTKILLASTIGAGTLSPNTQYSIDASGTINANKYLMNGVEFYTPDQKYDSITFDKAGNTKGIFFANSTANVGIVSDGTQIKIIDKDKSNSNIVVFHTLTQSSTSGYVMTANGGIKVLGNVDLNISSPKITTKDSKLILPENIGINTTTISNKYNLDVNGNINATDILLNGDSLKSNVKTNVLTANSIFIGTNNTANVIITSTMNVANINMTTTKSGINYANTRIYEDGHDIIFKDTKSSNTITVNANTQTINASSALNISANVNVAGTVDAKRFTLDGHDLDTSSVVGNRAFGSLILNDNLIDQNSDIKGLIFKSDTTPTHAIGYKSSALPSDKDALCIIDLRSGEDGGGGATAKKLISVYTQTVTRGTVTNPALEVHGKLKADALRFASSTENFDLNLEQVNTSGTVQSYLRFVNNPNSSTPQELIKIDPLSTDNKIAFPTGNVLIGAGHLTVSKAGSDFTDDFSITTIPSGAGNQKSIKFDTTPTTGAQILLKQTPSGGSTVIASTISHTSDNNLIISASHVGINKTNPLYTLHVDGDIKANNIHLSYATIDNFNGTPYFINETTFMHTANVAGKLLVTGQSEFTNIPVFNKGINAISTSTSTLGTANVVTLNVSGTSNTATANVVTLNVSGTSNTATANVVTLNVRGDATVANTLFANSISAMNNIVAYRNLIFDTTDPVNVDPTIPSNIKVAKTIRLTDNNNILTISGGTGWTTTGGLISLFGVNTPEYDKLAGVGASANSAYLTMGRGSVVILGGGINTPNQQYNSRLHIGNFPAGVIINYDNNNYYSTHQLDVNGSINATSYNINGQPFTAGATTTIGTTKIDFNTSQNPSLAGLTSIQSTTMKTNQLQLSASHLSTDISGRTPTSDTPYVMYIDQAPGGSTYLTIAGYDSSTAKVKYAKIQLTFT